VSAKDVPRSKNRIFVHRIGHIQFVFLTAVG
jgi:hypothetical protein